MAGFYRILAIMLALAVREARKAFGEVRALDGVSLELEGGELLGLLGPNGAGKTTLVRAIAGRVCLDAGGIEIEGHALDGNGARVALGLVPQEVAIYPLLTARENLEVFGRFHGLGGDELRRAVGWALEWTGLGGRDRESVKRFSGGMRRRLNIACGVLHAPRVILLDEPTVGVDPQSRERIYDMLAELKRNGASLLLTTHQLEEAEARCDRVVIIDHGRNVASGTVAELTARAVGGRHTVTVTLDRPPAAPPAGFAATDAPEVLIATVADVEAELPALLHRLRDAGSAVRDLQVRRPGLAEVFITLTGRELRE
ncbi:MAG: ABC transporter ATP-binding protein [Thermoanaerobaculales bacterium]